MVVADSAGIGMHGDAKTPPPSIEAHEARPRPVGGDDVEPAVAVEIRDGGVARGPLGNAPGASDRELALAVVQVHELLVWRVIARQDVEILVAVEIGQRRRISPVSSGAKIRRDERATAVVQQHAVEKRIVSPLGEDEIEIAVAIEVAHAHVRGRLGRRLELDDGREVARRGGLLCGDGRQQKKTSGKGHFAAHPIPSAAIVSGISWSPLNSRKMTS